MIFHSALWWSCGGPDSTLLGILHPKMPTLLMTTAGFIRCNFHATCCVFQVACNLISVQKKKKQLHATYSDKIGRTHL